MESSLNIIWGPQLFLIFQKTQLNLVTIFSALFLWIASHLLMKLIYKIYQRVPKIFLTRASKFHNPALNECEHFCDEKNYFNQSRTLLLIFFKIQHS
jgi:hypothetical protein